MVIAIIKLLHLLTILGLLGSTIVGLAHAKRISLQQLRLLNGTILILIPAALLTGTLLVQPKHYTFHTPWIDAAYIFLGVYTLAIILLFRKLARWPRAVYRMCYALLLILLIIVVRDAVTRSTWLVSA